MIGLQIFATYLVLSVFSGLILMAVDAAAGFRISWASPVVTALMLPPLFIVLTSGVAVMLFKVWAH